MADVVFDQVTKRFGDVLAVKDFTLEIPDQEFLVLVGPSGCGKSTALRLLAGLEAVSAGDIYIGDRRVNNVAAKDRDIAMVFQSYALYPHMSVYDNLAFGLTLRKVPKPEIQRRVQEAAQILAIGELLSRKPRQLSGGQRQRVALGRAIVREPAVFLLDEPLSNLDANLRVQTRAEVSKLHKRLGATFIYVTHDQVEAMTMATSIAVMREGVLQQMGRPQELYDRPVNVFVAGFIGSPAMNFFEVTVGGNAEAMFLRWGEVQVPVPETWAKHLVHYVDRRIIFGLRPENIHDIAYSPPGIMPVRIPANVDVTELIGNEIFLHLLSEDKPFLARVDPRTTARPGHRIEVMLDLSRMHAFDPDTEQRLIG
ncbi:MAG: ABC transporter ATP-binding protein [Dehalococcoidia bacterium]